MRVHPKWEAPKKRHKIFKIMKYLVKTQHIQSNWSWKKNKINKSTYQYTNKSLFVQNFRPLFLTAFSAIVVSWDLLGAKKVSSTHAHNFLKVNKTWRQKKMRNRIVAAYLLKESTDVKYKYYDYTMKKSKAILPLTCCYFGNCV